MELGQFHATDSIRITTSRIVVAYLCMYISGIVSTLTIMFMYIMWWYIYEYHLCNCFVEINSIKKKLNQAIYKLNPVTINSKQTSHSLFIVSALQKAWLGHAIKVKFYDTNLFVS